MDDPHVVSGRDVTDEERWRSPAILGPRLRLQVTRPRDHLVLTVTASDCEVTVAEDGVPRLVPTERTGAPRLIVTLPPQHVLEQVLQEKQGENDPKPGQPEQPDLPAGARFSGPSRLAFVLAADQTVDLTIEGILTAMNTLPLAVVPLAERRVVWHLLDAAIATVGLATAARRVGVSAAETTAERVRTTRVLAAAGLRRAVEELPPAARRLVVDTEPSERLRVIGELRDGLRGRFDFGHLFPFVVGRPRRRRPNHLETALEVPSRLQLSPSSAGAWAHAVDVDDTPGATVELWNTRLGVRDGTAERPTVDEDDTTQRIVRAVWTRDMEDGTPPSKPWPFRSSLKTRNRIDIVELSTGEPGTSWRLPPPDPVSVNHLALTSLGAFIDVRGNWDVAGTLLTEWQHRTTVGRDQFVRVVEKGYLCPFGHRAVYVTETRRLADPSLPEGDFAILWQRHYIQLKERVRGYGHRGMTYLQVVLEPKTTPDINDPGDDERVFWPMIGTTPFAFKIRFVDQDGHEHGYDAPLLFVSERIKQGAAVRPTPAEVYEKYALTSDGLGDVDDSPWMDWVRHDLGRRRVAVAPKGPDGEAAYETDVLRFTADLADDTCTPRLLFGEFVIPAVAAATGEKKPLPLSYAEAYLTHGFDPVDNHGAVVLANAAKSPADSLTFASSDKSGGFLNPGQHIRGIARGTGPVSDLAAAASGAPVDPSQLFDQLGKLLGLFDLGDVLADLLPDEVPKYVAQLLDVVGAVTGGLERAAELLDSAGASATQLRDAVDDLEELLDQTPTPGPAEFTALINGTLRPAVSAGLSPAVLDGLPMAERALVKRALETVDGVLDPPGLPFDPASLLADLAAGKPIASVLDHVHLEWRPPVSQWPAGSTSDAIFLPSNPRTLLLAVDVRGGDLVAEPSVEVLAQLTDFKLQLVPGMPLLHLPFKRLYFRATTGAKTEIDVDLGQLEWLGVLGFVDKLRQLIPGDGFSDPPSVTVDTQGIAAGFSLVLPNVAVGAFNLSNLSMAADVRLPFLGDAPAVGFSFCSRERPFTVAVLFLGGGGFFGLRVSPKKVVLLEAAIEFGATLALDFGVASGSVSVMAGVYLRLEADDGSLTGYLRIRGEVDVLGLISASIEMYMGLTYEFGSGKVVGKATIKVEVEVLFFSTSVSITAERKFAGSKGDPTFADALGPFVDPDCPWIDYCQAFAEV